MAMRIGLRFYNVMIWKQDVAKLGEVFAIHGKLARYRAVHIERRFDGLMGAAGHLEFDIHDLFCTTLISRSVAL